MQLPNRTLTYYVKRTSNFMPYAQLCTLTITKCSRSYCVRRHRSRTTRIEIYKTGQNVFTNCYLQTLNHNKKRLWHYIKRYHNL